MLYHAKNGNLPMENSDMDYISFGTGKEALILIPGLGDGLTTVKGKALAFALLYRMYAKDYTVYLFSRRNHLPEGYTTRDMARDQAWAMKTLGISKAHILGISQGGMIAQYLAIDHPQLVGKLILAVTSPKPNKILQKTLEAWICLAQQGNYKELMMDTAEKSYSEAYLKKYRFLYPLLGRMGKPKSFARFLIQARSCLTHWAAEELDQISCPVLILGGGCDKIVGPACAPALAEKIRCSKLWIYENLGHVAYEESKDFHDRVIEFLKG